MGKPDRFRAISGLPGAIHLRRIMYIMLNIRYSFDRPQSRPFALERWLQKFSSKG